MLRKYYNMLLFSHKRYLRAYVYLISFGEFLFEGQILSIDHNNFMYKMKQKASKI